MAEPSRTVAAARRAWTAVLDAGGVVSRGDLQEAWGASQQHVQQLSTRLDFPEPCSGGRGALWLTAAVEQWRRDREVPGKPGKASAKLTALADPIDLRAAEKAWQALQRSGGVTSTPELAQRWEIPERTARHRTGRPGFPEPVAAGRWLTAEVDAWHEQATT